MGREPARRLRRPPRRARARPTRDEAVHTLGAAGQILQACAGPLLPLVLAAVGVLGLPAALWSGVVVLVVELGLFALLTARRAPQLSWWERAGTVVALRGLGAPVVALKSLAH